MKKWALLLALVICAFSATGTIADTINPAPPMGVPVADRSPTALAAGIQTALSQNMLQLSHNPQIMTTPLGQSIAKNSMQWVQSYGYVEQPSANPTQPGLFLQVNFDNAALQKALQNTPEKTPLENKPLPNTSPTTDANTLSLNTSPALPAAPRSLILKVSNINTLSEYYNAVHALRANKEVVAVSTNDINSDNMDLTVRVADNSAQFEQNLSHDPRFQASDTQPNTASEAHYAWVGDHT